MNWKSEKYKTKKKKINIDMDRYVRRNRIKER